MTFTDDDDEEEPKLVRVHKIYKFTHTQIFCRIFFIPYYIAEKSNTIYSLYCSDSLILKKIYVEKDITFFYLHLFDSLFFSQL